MKKNIIKKSILYLIIIMVVFNILSCSKTTNTNQSEENKFYIKKAESLIDNYMRSMISEDQGAMNKLLTTQLLKTSKTIEKSSIKVKGYKLDETTEVGDTAIFKVKVTSTSLNGSKSSIDNYVFKVVIENFNYKISEVKTVLEKECYFENYGLRIRNKSAVESQLLIDSDGIPQFGFAKEDKSKALKLELPRTNFQNITFDYSGDNLAISIVDKLAFIGIVKVANDSVETAASQGGVGQNGGGDKKQDPGQPIKGGSMREKPVGKELTVLDALKDCKVDFMVFSPDEKYLLVQYTNKDTRKCLRIYDANKGELISFMFEDNFNIDNLDIKYSYFEKETLNFEVTPKEDKKELEKQVAGLWQLDLKKFKAKKV